MAEIADIIREKVLAFYDKARRELPIEKVLIFGSQVGDKAGPDSDIDVAVVVKSTDHLQRMGISQKLMHIASQVDSAIEPKCVFIDEFKNHEQASILSEILKNSFTVV